MQNRLFFIVFSLWVLTGCSTPKDLAYISNVPNRQSFSRQDYTSTIQPNDLLMISVTSQTPESVIPFNQETNRAVNSGTSFTMVGSNMANDGYLVDDKGCILFPELGLLHVGGLSVPALSDSLSAWLKGKDLVTDPMVHVRRANFRIAVLGEVNQPGSFPIMGERCSIFDALALAGDLTIYGIRTNVRIVRETDGVRTIGSLDLTDGNIFESSFFYLHPNDVVYVEPNKQKKRLARHNESRTLQIASTSASLLSTLALVLYYYKLSASLQ